MNSQSYFLSWRIPNPRSGKGIQTLTYTDYLKGAKTDEQAVSKARELFAKILIRDPEARFLRLTKKVTKTKVLLKKLT